MGWRAARCASGTPARAAPSLRTPRPRGPGGCGAPSSGALGLSPCLRTPGWVPTQLPAQNGLLAQCPKRRTERDMCRANGGLRRAFSAPHSLSAWASAVPSARTHTAHAGGAAAPASERCTCARQSALAASAASAAPDVPRTDAAGPAAEATTGPGSCRAGKANLHGTGGGERNQARDVANRAAARSTKRRTSRGTKTA